MGDNIVDKIIYYGDILDELKNNLAISSKICDTIKIDKLLNYIEELTEKYTDIVDTEDDLPF